MALYLGSKKIASNNTSAGSSGENADVSGLISYPIGSVYITSTNTDPATLIGGEWELIDKEFTPIYQDGGFEVNSNTKTDYFKFARAGHTITLENRWVTAVATTDSTIEFGTWDLSILGVTALSRISKFISWSDGGEGIAFCQVNTDGTLATYDTLPASTTTSGLASGIEFNGTVTVVIPYTLMLESACNKFYWKRKG